MTQHASPTRGASRRDFLAATAGTTLAALPLLTPNVHAAGSDVLRVGLVGCGNRGTGAATQALNADPQVKLVALGDMFADRLQQCLETLQGNDKVARKVDVKPDHRFTGFNAYKDVLGSGIDVVLLATPPHFRPLHLKAAVAAGKHIFCEKPVAVDAPGVLSVLDSSAEAKKKGLSLVSGLCWRYHHSMRETFARIHDGAIGDIVAMQTSYLTGRLWDAPRQKEWSDMEWQLRNWLYFTWLSGDFIVEQHIHSLDKIAWAMKDEPPLSCTGIGGRQVRVQPQFGNVFDHFAVVYEYPNGVKAFSRCRQQPGCEQDVSDHFFGTRGTCDVITNNPAHGEIRAPGSRKKKVWSSNKTPEDMYQNEHNELFASIRSGRPINNGEYMSRSTMMAIMGRMAGYTGKTITWDMALKSRQDLTPRHYEFGPLPVRPVAKPGVTKFA